MARSGLTPKQARFVEEYLIDLNASDAARRAGYSRKTADEIGRRYLEKLGLPRRSPRRRPSDPRGPRSRRTW